MGYNPWINAAKAAHAEVSSDEAISFLKATALSHTLLVAFYALEAVYWTVEAGRLTRRFVDSFSTPEAEIIIAGLLCPAKDEPPITTEAIVTNQQKLEQHITNTIKGIYDNVQSNRVSLESHQISGQSDPEVSTEPVRSSSDGVCTTSRTSDPSSKPTRTRKPRATSGDTGKAKDKTTSSRVPRKSGQVSQE